MAIIVIVMVENHCILFTRMICRANDFERHCMLYATFTEDEYLFVKPVKSLTLFNLPNRPTYSARSLAEFGRILELPYGAVWGVHAFGNNSAESKPICMKSAAL